LHVENDFYHFLYFFNRIIIQSSPLGITLFISIASIIPFMKVIKAIATFIIAQHFFLFSFSQKNKTIQFEQCKGKLPIPVCTIYGYSDLKCVKYKQITPTYKNIAFITDSAAEVRAIHAGIVSKVFPVDEGYAIVTSFGDYYITYYPVINPVFKKGDLVYNGQPISRVSSPDNVPEINILMSKTTTFIDPYKWFRW